MVLSPVTEELVFRSCMCWLLGAAGWSPFYIIVAGPALFSIAHAHHGFADPRNSLENNVIEGGRSTEIYRKCSDYGTIWEQDSV